MPRNSKLPASIMTIVFTGSSHPRFLQSVSLADFLGSWNHQAWKPGELRDVVVASLKSGGPYAIAISTMA